MSSMLPVAVYGLKVPAGDVAIPAIVDFPATFRITMAAIDPSANPEHTGTVNGNAPSRATLKVIYDSSGPDIEDDSEDSGDERNFLKNLLAGGGMGDDSGEDKDEDESSSDDEERNGGPSDPSRTKKARKEAALQQLMKSLAEQNEGEGEMDVDKTPRVNGVEKKSSVNKGKGKATDNVKEDDSDANSEDSLAGMEELIVCTLEAEKNYQQPLDITIPEGQRTYFKVSGTHAIYLTGNYVVPADDGHGHKHGLYDSEDEEDEYDMASDEDELEDDEESDELDDLEDPRITEVGSEDEEEAPKPIKRENHVQKGKNKRVREESSENEAPVSLDDIMAKSLKPAEPTANGIANGEPKLSKKQLKKLKNNAGKAVETAVESKDVKYGNTASNKEKGDKKVQFAKTLEQGPAASASPVKSESDKTKTEKYKEESKPKASLGVKTVQGVKIDDKKLGSGPAARKGNNVGLRYIGKLKDGKVFDANKKGKPFTFTLGHGSVIKGWDIGVIGMSVGGERRLVIPAELAYGKKAMPGIPANSELTFDLKLLEIN